MSVTEITILQLRDASTFNPMSILELLRQMVTTYAHIAGTKFKAYQEKEEYSKFYVIGGWSSIQAHQAFTGSEMHKKVVQLLATTLQIVMVELVEIDSARITDMAEPIIALERLNIQDKSAFLTEWQARLSDTTDAQGGFVHETNTFQEFRNMKTVSQDGGSIVNTLETLKTLILKQTLCHIEVNQFI